MRTIIFHEPSFWSAKFGNTLMSLVIVRHKIPPDIASFDAVRFLIRVIHSAWSISCLAPSFESLLTLRDLLVVLSIQIGPLHAGHSTGTPSGTEENCPSDLNPTRGSTFLFAPLINK